MAKALLAACHPAPTVAVTTLVTVLGFSVGLRGAALVLLALTVLAGQLSIGWSNDWLDAARDRAVARTDKPVASGRVSERTVRWAALCALALMVPISLALGWLPAVVHALCVAMGWAYNAGVKATVASFVPYAVCFGLLPAVATTALPGRPWPPWWMVATGALLGLGAHVLNVLPDLEQDRLTGVRGLPQRLGRRAASVVAPLLLLAATVVVAFGPPGPPGPVAWGGVGVAALLGGQATLTALRRHRSSWPFRCALLIAAVDVALLLYHG
ncbi:MAG TPA: UbiA family prenyltransferase [Segeticoccus sp.]|uniref:UbiA family prenyltransferase n=1 Tax=Segeticoccus sp. TaxID=2706531 RepID=UPI002D80CEAB|nr:UbiA family prenyltransferase [Segeticoccus sp.]HET8600757.1 UbiA family prenyltransferase [Segeticoccus sp.]